MHRHWILICFSLVAVFSLGQDKATLETSGTQVELVAGPHAPRLVTLRGESGTWQNQVDELPIPNLEVNGQKTDLTWTFNSGASHSDQHVVSFVYEAASRDLRLTWIWEARSEHGPIEHQIRIENRGANEIWLPLQPSFAFDWRITAHSYLEHFYVEKGADTPSANGTHVIEASDGYKWEGKSSTYAQPRPGEAREIIPYLLVEHPDFPRDGWYVGIEFSGRTHLSLARSGNSLHGEVRLDPNPGPFLTRLMPGETFETPKIFLGATSGGPDATANVLHRWIREVLINHDTWNDPHYPFLVNNSWGGGMQVDEQIASRMLRDAADLGFEMFHVDAGWFRGVGDWYPNPTKFPHGLQSIADEVHAHGMKFGLWVDWTQAALDTAPGALNVRDPEVKDWLTTDLPVSWKPDEFKGQTIDIGAPKAKAWALRETNRIVNDYKLDMLEHDGYLVAQGCDASDHPHAPPDPLNRCTYRDAGFVFTHSSNSTDVSYHAVRAYYDIQSNLRREHPGLLLEVCNDGGRMVDFGSAAHGDYFSITDTYDPLSNRRAFYDTSFALPPAMLEAYVERWPAPSLDNFRYMLRSGMMGWLSIMIDTTSWTSEQHAAAKAELQLYKTQLRPLIRDADLYHISERPDGIHWDGVQYFDPRTRRGAIYAFHGSIPTQDDHVFRLQGLNADAQYELKFYDHSAADQTMNGRTLMTKGILVHLPHSDSSEIVFLEELAAASAGAVPH